MKFTVIGAGAVGLLLASYLAEQGDVTLVVRRDTQQQALAQGITRIIGEQKVVRRVNVTTTIPNDAAQHIFICTKAYAVTHVLQALQAVRYKTVTGCQNGLAHIEKLSAFMNSSACVVEFGAFKHDDATVEHTGIGRIVIGALVGNKPSITAHAQLPVIYESDIQAIVWRKALLNCLINPLTAVFQVKNGTLIEDQQLFQLLMQLYRELQAALPRQMEMITLGDVIMLCEKTAANDSSMCVDVRLGRKTEIEEIVGMVLKASTQPMPTLSMLYAQIQFNEMR